MSKVQRLCLCLGVCLLVVAGFVRPATGQPVPVPVPVPVPAPVPATWPYCGAWRGCATNNTPGYYCRFSNRHRYYVCATVTWPETCQPGNSWWGRTCWGLTPTGASCSIYFANCTS
jgi:hypothetical protein